MTVRDLLKSSLRLVNALAPGEAGENAELQDAMLVANDLLETWRLERLMVPYEQRQAFTLTTSHNPHTIGTGGDFNTDRPIRIERAGLLDVGASPNFELPLDVIPADEYTRVSLKDFESTIPEMLYYEAAMPLGKIYLYPVPTIANKLALYTWAALSAFVSLDDPIVMPPGYTRALRYNLAIDLAPEFNVPVPEHVKETAEKAKTAVQSINVRVPVLGFEMPVRRGSDPNWWRTGE